MTGPFKINGVPLRRVNHKYVIATKTRVPIKGVDEKVLEKVGKEGYFTKDKPKKKVGEDSFFQQGEKSEVGGPILLYGQGVDADTNFCRRRRWLRNVRRIKSRLTRSSYRTSQRRSC